MIQKYEISEKYKDRTSYTQIPLPSHSKIYSKIFVIHKHWPQRFIMILLQDTTKYRHHFSTSSVALGWLLPREKVLGLSRFCLYSAVVLLLCKKQGLLHSTTNQASQLKLHYCCKPSVIYVGLLSGILVENIACILPLQTGILIHECCKKWRHLLYFFELKCCRFIA